MDIPGESSQLTQVIWGTNINSDKVCITIRDFFQNFYAEDQEAETAQEPFYFLELKQVIDTEEYILNVNCDHVYEQD